MRLIGTAFVALALYLAVQSTIVLAFGYRSHRSAPGIAWTAITAIVMLTLAADKSRTGKALANAVLRTDGRVTAIDGVLATAVLIGLALNASLDWWWADPAAGYVVVYYAICEARGAFVYPPLPPNHRVVSCTVALRSWTACPCLATFSSPGRSDPDRVSAWCTAHSYRPIIAARGSSGRASGRIRRVDRTTSRRVGSTRRRWFASRPKVPSS
jgi:hypothetical protein